MGDTRSDEVETMAARRAAERFRLIRLAIGVLSVPALLLAGTPFVLAYASLSRELSGTTSSPAVGMWASVSILASVAAIGLASTKYRSATTLRQTRARIEQLEESLVRARANARTVAGPKVPPRPPEPLHDASGRDAGSGRSWAADATWAAILVAVVTGLFSIGTAWLERDEPAPDCMTYAQGLASLRRDLTDDELVAMVDQLTFTGYEERCGRARDVVNRMAHPTPPQGTGAPNGGT